MKISAQNMQTFFSVFKNTFLKSYVQDQHVQTILKNAQLITPNIYQTLFTHGDKINQYFFLINGVVGLFKGSAKYRQPNHNDQSDIVQGNKVIGEYFCTLHTLREYTAIVKSDNCQIIKVNKQFFDQICSEFVQRYNQVERYAKNILKLPKKINSFEIFTLKTYRLGRYIKLNSQIGVIIKGQCKVLLSVENQEDKKQSKDYLPPIMKVKQKPKIKQVALLSNNQWICTQNLQQQFKNKFNYVVSSESLSLLTTSIQNLSILQPNKLRLLRRLHHDRKQRVFLRERLTTDTSRQTSISPKLKHKMEETSKILQKLDPNLSPNVFLRKYKLGYNYIRHQNRERNERNSLICQPEHLKRQKTERKLKEYYKAKDWSQYVKIPNTKL